MGIIYNIYYIFMGKPICFTLLRFIIFILRYTKFSSCYSLILSVEGQDWVLKMAAEM